MILNFLLLVLPSFTAHFYVYFVPKPKPKKKVEQKTHRKLFSASNAHMNGTAEKSQ